MTVRGPGHTKALYRTIRDTAPDTWSKVFCPDGEWHTWRKRWLGLRRGDCSRCGAVKWR